MEKYKPNPYVTHSGPKPWDSTPWKNIDWKLVAKTEWDSHEFRTWIDKSKYNSELWTNIKSRDNTFEIIMEALVENKKTPGFANEWRELEAFGIFLINDGFELVQFDQFSRVFKKEDQTISFSYIYHGPTVFSLPEIIEKDKKLYITSSLYYIPKTKDEYEEAKITGYKKYK